MLEESNVTKKTKHAKFIRTALSFSVFCQVLHDRPVPVEPSYHTGCVHTLLPVVLVRNINESGQVRMFARVKSSYFPLETR